MAGFHHCTGMNARKTLNRERQARSLKLPSWCVARLDAEGVMKGMTWRQMPGPNSIVRACNWWLWKRGMLVLDDERAEAAALADISQEEGGDA